jgi:hypothetical protein
MLDLLFKERQMMCDLQPFCGREGDYCGTMLIWLLLIRDFIQEFVFFYVISGIVLSSGCRLFVSVGKVISGTYVKNLVIAVLSSKSNPKSHAGKRSTYFSICLCHCSVFDFNRVNCTE